MSTKCGHRFSTSQKYLSKDISKSTNKGEKGVSKDTEIDLICVTDVFYDRANLPLLSSFSDNVLDATNVWTKQINDKSSLKGLPETAIEQDAAAATQRDAEGYMLTLEFPSYYAVMSYADDRALREEMYRAYSTRASDQGGNKKLDNSLNLERILKLRQEKARLLAREQRMQAQRKDKQRALRDGMSPRERAYNRDMFDSLASRNNGSALSNTGRRLFG